MRDSAELSAWGPPIDGSPARLRYTSLGGNTLDEIVEISSGETMATTRSFRCASHFS